jgi:TIR domain
MKAPVFISYAKEDKGAARRLAALLAERDVEAWIDRAGIEPGDGFVRAIEAALGRARTVLVLVVALGGSVALGAAGTRLGGGDEAGRRGPRGDPRSARPRGTAAAVSVRAALPLFLKSRGWVDFRGPAPDPFERLIWEITGEEPARPTPSYPDHATRTLSESLESAYRRKAELDSSGEDTKAVIDEILALRRRLRQGAQLKAVSANSWISWVSASRPRDSSYRTAIDFAVQSR